MEIVTEDMSPLTLDEQSGLQEFFEKLRTSKRRALLLDYDGTLAPFCIRPKEAFPYPGVRRILDQIMGQEGNRVVIVSGRWTRDLVPLLGLGHRPEIWGSHGWEQLQPDGRYTVAAASSAALQHLVAVDEWASEVERLGGRCEFKPAGVAIHWRGLPEKAISEIRNLITEHWASESLESGLAWHDFDGGIELRIPGRNKAYAVETVLSELSSGVAAAYLGDDLTDEDAFKAIATRGIGVLVRNEYRPTAAQYWLRPPQGLLEFLERWRDSCDMNS